MTIDVPGGSVWTYDTYKLQGLDYSATQISRGSVSDITINALAGWTKYIPATDAYSSGPVSFKQGLLIKMPES